jgi:dynein heavy chain 2
MDGFLDDSSSTPLQAALVTTSDNKLEIKLSNEIKLDSRIESVVYFTKVDASIPITVDNIHRTVSISSMNQSAVQGLYTSLHHVFLPLLSKDSTVDGRVQALLQDLEAGLGKIVRGTGRTGRELDERTAKGIMTLQDEATFWYEVANSTHSPATQKKAEFFRSQIGELARILSRPDITYEDMINDDLKTILEILDSVWTLKELSEDRDVEDVMGDASFLYQKDRMVHLLRLIGDELTGFIQKSFASADIWKSPFAKAEKEIANAMDLCRSWNEITQQLTSEAEFWKHRWNDKPFKDVRIGNLEQRLKQISDVRSTHESLQGLLSAEEQRGLQLDRIFSSFSGIKALHFNSYTDAGWVAAMSEYEASMRPVEDQIVAKLRGEFESKLLPGFAKAVSEQGDRLSKGTTGSRGATAQPYQLLQSFSRYQLLLKRGNIENRLAQEREKLLTMVLTYIDQAQKEFEKYDSSDERAQDSSNGEGKNLAGIVNTVVFMSQLYFKVDQTVTTAAPLIGELRKVEDLQRQSRELLRDLTQAKRNNYEKWKKSTLEALNNRDEPIALQTNARLMSFDQREGRLHVHYSERLVMLLREARQLCAIGCPIPSEVEKAVETAHKFFSDAMVLKQVATLYNTIGDQIIDCHKPMLMEEAIAFEKIVQDQKKTSDGKHVSWDTPIQLKEYIASLNTAMRNLNSKNRRLRMAHKQISEIVVRLMNTDLVRQRSKWKDALSQIRGIINDVEAEGFKNTRPWMIHWDYQLYKALDYQYKMGLESCHEILQQIDTKLVLRQKKLVFEPSYEELRSMYYRELKSFINIPLSFKGVGDSDIFRSITNRNSDRLLLVFSQAERLFKKLSETLDKYTPWVAFAAIDINDLIEANLVEVEDYEANFRMTKTRGRDIDKLPDVEKVDCINVDASGAKSAAEELLKAFNDALGFALRKSAQADVEHLEAFVKESLDALSTMPQTFEEIVKSTAK